MPDDLPFPFVWDGEAMRPPPGMVLRAAERYAKNTRYWLIEQTQQVKRSRQSHDHYFAVLDKAWRNLPEEIADDFPTAEHLRKYALVKTGFYNLQVDVMDTDRDAQRLAVACRRHDYEIVKVTGAAVYRFTPKSQSEAAMPAGEFQKSKQAVIDYIADLIGVKSEELTAEVGQEA